MKPVVQVVAAVVIVVSWLIVEPPISSLWRESKAKRLSFENLKQASSEEELRNAVGKLGLFIPLPETQWIAICYLDSHYPRIWSVSTARDSGGQWWTSAKHFCGRLRGFDEISSVREFTPESYSERITHDPDFECLDRIINSKTLDEARRKMVELGFTRSLELEERAAKSK